MRPLLAMTAGLLIAAPGLTRAQDTAASALGAPAQPKTASPAASATAAPGQGAAIPSNSGATGQDQARDAARAVAQAGVQAQNDARQAFSQHTRSLNWLAIPQTYRGPAPSGVNQVTAVLNLPDGRTVSLNRGPMAGGPPVMMGSNVGLTAGPPGGPGAMAAQGAVFLEGDGDTLKAHTSFVLPSGDFLDPPVVTIAASGGGDRQPAGRRYVDAYPLRGSHPFAAGAGAG